MTFRKPELKAIDALEFDPENPRLPSSTARSQDEMLRYLAAETSIEELMEVIAENGYFEGEPVLAYPSTKKKDVFIVIEGNRRLAAVKLLQRPEQYPQRRRIQEIATAAKHRPRTIPVIVCDERSEVLSYLGYRHITGVKQWDPLAKARYMKQLFVITDKRLSPEERYKTVAREIGSRRDHVKRTLDALAAYQAIDQSDFFNISGLDESSLSFSLLSTALGYPSISEFCGTDKDPITNPETLRVDNLQRLTRWMFEDKSASGTFLGESRNIQKLALIVTEAKALDAVDRGATLEVAYRMTEGAKEELLFHLYQAQSNLQVGNSIAPSVDPNEEMMSVAGDVRRQATSLYRTLESARKSDDV